MPEFFAEHTPDNLDDSRYPGLGDFRRGYFECAEFLASGYGPKYENENNLDDEDRAKLRGFTRKAIASGKADCLAFYLAESDRLEKYEEESGRDMRSAGHDFWLSRNGHGAGFFDRGNGTVFRELQSAARIWGTVECEAYRNRLVFS